MKRKSPDTSVRFYLYRTVRLRMCENLIYQLSEGYCRCIRSGSHGRSCIFGDPVLIHDVRIFLPCLDELGQEIGVRGVLRVHHMFMDLLSREFDDGRGKDKLADNWVFDPKVQINHWELAHLRMAVNAPFRHALKGCPYNTRIIHQLTCERHHIADV